jgi:hypothetical protein
MTSKLLLILLASSFISGSLESKMIGQTSALIPEAGITSKKINDNIFACFKISKLNLYFYIFIIC